MKPILPLLLISTLALAAPGEKAKPVNGADASAQSSASVKIDTKSDGVAQGKAVITIEVNGKKEVREIDLGNATEIRVESSTGTDGGAGGGGKAGKGERHTFLGVAAEALPEEVGSQLPIGDGEGVIVRSIVAGSPAEQAGLQKNDVITRIDGQAVSDHQQLKRLTLAKKPGDPMRVTYYRGGQKREADVKLGEHQDVGDEPVNAKKGAGWFNMFPPGAGTRIEKRAIIVDKDGNVIKRTGDAGDWMKNYEEAIREALPAEQVKKLQGQIEAMRKQVEAAQQQAEEAAERAAEAIRRAAEPGKPDAAPEPRK